MLSKLDSPEVFGNSLGSATYLLPFVSPALSLEVDVIGLMQVGDDLFSILRS